MLGRLKTLRSIFTNPWTLIGIAAYLISVIILSRNKTFAPEDAIVVLVIFGIILPVIAWVTTLRVQPIALVIQRNLAEMWLLLACLLFVTLFLVWGPALLDSLLPLSWTTSE